MAVAGFPAFGQEGQDDRGWQDILKDVVRDAVEESTSSSTRLGRIRHIDVVSRSGSMVELEVELQGITEPDRTLLTVEVFDENYSTVGGFEAAHDPIPEGDGTVLLRVSYSGGRDVRSLGLKVNLVNAETNAVATRRKVPLPWEWRGDGSDPYVSGSGAIADPGGLSTRSGGSSSLENREPQIVELEPRRMPGTPAMEEINVALAAPVVKPHPQEARPTHRPPPPTSSSSASISGGDSSGKPTSSTSSSGKTESTNRRMASSAATALAAGSVVLATSVDLYATAGKATWESQAGRLPYNGSTNDKRGFVRPLGTSELIDGRSHDKVLWTHPEWKDGGYIKGSFDVTIPPNATTFEADVGFLPKVTRSDGVQFSVLIRHGPRSYNLIRRTVRPSDGVISARGQVPEAVRGQKVTVELWASSGGTSAQDWFAWSAPVIR